ncbi:MAG: BglI family type II restriction endonuclease [Symploca sp. SIO2G7]|nr:BglI family type II restriction endonuclease [Symploca sp. SIO2G7]
MAKKFLGLNQVVASNLKKLRKELGISQEDLAEKCGLHRTYVGAIERSERNITLQPLSKISFACVPNGLLLHEQPKYLSSFPTLFFPGKDDKTKNPQKIRCRVSFEILRNIADWRFREFLIV